MAKYNHEKLIGHGTFGHVWLVKSNTTGSNHVMKEVRIMSMTEAEQEQALAEASILARCNHQNIIRYKEAMYEKEREMLCIVMEYAEGGDLYATIALQKGVYFEEYRILDWFVQICLALQYIHNRNILHRDLKTQNIFLTRNKMIKVGDFGISRVLKEPRELAKTAIGTPYYLSPEICKRMPYNSKSDIWALGCVLFEMVSLAHPFQAPNFAELVTAIINSKRKNLPSHCSPLVGYLVNVLLKASPEDRPSADEILKMPLLEPNISLYVDVHTLQTPTISPPVQDGSRRHSANDILKHIREAASLKRRASITSPEFVEVHRPITPKKRVDSTENRLSLLRPKATKMDPERNPKIKATISKIPTFVKARKPSATAKTQIATDKCVARAKVDENSQKYVSPNTYTLNKQLDDVALAQACETVEPKIQRTSESDCGYHSADTSKKLITAKKSFNKTLSKGSALRISSSSTTNNSAKPGTPIAIDDVFVNPKVKLEAETTSVDAVAVSLHCQHNTQCHRCVLDMLWKNRIRRKRIIGVTFRNDERSGMKVQLLSVFGRDSFEKVYSVLASDWEKESESTSETLMNLVGSLTFDQVQHIALMMQLIQLDLVKEEREET